MNNVQIRFDQGETPIGELGFVINVIALEYKNGIESQCTWDRLGYLPKEKTLYSYPSRLMLGDELNRVDVELSLLYAALSEICPLYYIDVRRCSAKISLCLRPSTDQMDYLESVFQEMIDYQLNEQTQIA